MQSASKVSCLQNMNFFNLVLESHRLSCYISGFSGEYSSISQEYPPVKLPDQRSGLLKRKIIFYGIHLRLKVGAFCQFFRKLKVRDTIYVAYKQAKEKYK